MIKLAKIPTNAPKKVGKEAIKKITKDLVKQLGELQHILYAQKKYSVLVVLQGMDATGKDGAARKVFANLPRRNWHTIFCGAFINVHPKKVWFKYLIVLIMRML